MKKIERGIMWAAAISALVLGITQTATAIIRGEWFMAFVFAVFIAISKGMMEALDAQKRKEAADDGDAA